jgi:anti-sigma factor RsiW
MNRATHPFAPEEMMAYLDGELAADRAAAAAAHLEHCAECRALAASLRGVSRNMLDWEVDPAPESLAAAVLAVQKEAAQRPARRALRPSMGIPVRAHYSWTRMLLWGAGAFAAILVVFSLSVPTLMRSRRASAPPTAGSSAYQDSPGALSKDAVRASREQHAPVASRNMDARQAVAAVVPGGGGGAENAAPVGPIIIRTASLTIETKEFENARAALEELLRAHQGYFGQLGVSAPHEAGRTLTAMLRIPAKDLDAALVGLRRLGRVTSENQEAQDVTGQYVDLTARLHNGQETEQRLIQVLRERTGKVGDVLQVEEQIARVRGEIEQMEAERKTMESQVRYASIQLRLVEEYKAPLSVTQPTTGTRLNNAFVEGFRSAADMVLDLVTFVLGAGPSLILIALALFWPARWVLRRIRAFFARRAATGVVS